ncbi:hypothetical protein [Pseudarthrobacter sulfonivorans]|uniref:hypothetical protein n=1 Tax=Pseudarthrobacter sulfonivorans TaxID=121292 RepID=UPI002106F3EB|nr:hypothetical protein [Pseudarthrobacter sulfonivorans]
MNHNNTRRERWVALLAALTFIFGFGVVVGNIGFRVDAGALGNVYGVRPHQWGVLLSGFFGSVAGGAVAVWVLRRTIEHQEANHQLQLGQAADLHAKQLRQAQDLHSDQLSAHQTEATRERSHTAAATLMSGLWLVNRTSKTSPDEMRQQIDSIILAAHTLRLEHQHDVLAQALMAMLGELEASPEVVAASEPARKKLLQITGKVSAAVIVWFQSDSSEGRERALMSVRQAEIDIRNLVAASA